jgi:hypothetical protein
LEVRTTDLACIHIAVSAGFVVFKAFRVIALTVSGVGPVITDAFIGNCVKGEPWLAKIAKTRVIG